VKDLAGTLLFIVGAVIIGLAIGLVTELIPFTITDSNWVLGAIVFVLILLALESFRRSRRYQKRRREARAAAGLTQ
jgi:hypothetical protein